MQVSRRAIGIGLLATSAAATGGYLYLRSNPHVAGYLGEKRRLFGFYGGEKQAFLDSEQTQGLLARRFGLDLDARRAGSVEQVRERAILDQKPDFLWPSSSVLVQLARESGVKVVRDQVIFTSPIVIYSWDKVADGLVARGIAQSAGGPRYRVDLAKLLKAVLDGETWAAVGVPGLAGRMRIVSTDPNHSNSGFTFAALMAGVLAGDVVTADTLAKVEGPVQQISRRMGFRPSSSGKMFEDYIAGGMASHPLIVGYENQLVEWVIEDEARWKRLEANAPAKPVILYPTPTMNSVHNLIVTTKPAEALIDALLSDVLQDLAWERHGFRGPLASIGKSRNPILTSRLIETVDAVLPMPDALVMLALTDKLKS